MARRPATWIRAVLFAVIIFIATAGLLAAMGHVVAWSVWFMEHAQRGLY